jgi:hypothetical protein
MFIKQIEVRYELYIFSGYSFLPLLFYVIKDFIILRLQELSEC